MHSLSHTPECSPQVANPNPAVVTQTGVSRVLRWAESVSRWTAFSDVEWKSSIHTVLRPEAAFFPLSKSEVGLECDSPSSGWLHYGQKPLTLIVSSLGCEQLMRDQIQIIVFSPILTDG